MQASMKIFCLHYSQIPSQPTSAKLLGETRIFYTCKAASGDGVLQIGADGMTPVEWRLEQVEVV
jgi:hypothetical protein